MKIKTKKISMFSKMGAVLRFFYGRILKILGLEKKDTCVETKSPEIIEIKGALYQNFKPLKGVFNRAHFILNNTKGGKAIVVPFSVFGTKTVWFSVSSKLFFMYTYSGRLFNFFGLRVYSTLTFGISDKGTTFILKLYKNLKLYEAPSNMHRVSKQGSQKSQSMRPLSRRERRHVARGLHKGS